MRRCLAAIFLFSQLFCSSLVLSQSPVPYASGSAQKAEDRSFSAEKAAIENVLRIQVDAWNRHDLDEFMRGYWNSSELTFFSGANERNGWQATIERYRAAYASEGREMGKLDFSGLRVEMLDGNAAFVRGSWHLSMADGKTPHGLFTLVFRKFPEGWKIVHDHTSAAE